MVVRYNGNIYIVHLKMYYRYNTMNLLAIHRDALWIVLSLLPLYQPMQLLRLSRAWRELRNTSWYTRYEHKYCLRYFTRGRGRFNPYVDRLDLVASPLTGKVRLPALHLDVQQRLRVCARTGRMDVGIPALIPTSASEHVHIALKFGHADVARMFIRPQSRYWKNDDMYLVLECILRGYIVSLNKLRIAGVNTIPVRYIFESYDYNGAVARYIYKYAHPSEYDGVLRLPRRPTMNCLRSDLLAKYPMPIMINTAVIRLIDG